MVGVAAGLLGGVDVGGWDEFGVSVGSESHGPVGGVDEPVVVAAEGDAVVAVGVAAVAPEHDVVDVGPAGWSFAAGEGAATVPEEDRGAGGAGERAAGAADVDGDARAVEEGGDDGGVAGEASGGLGGE